MILKRLYHSASSARALFYSAFGSPNFGITWSVVAFLSGLAYLIYNERKRRRIEPARKETVAGIASDCEEAAASDFPNVAI